MKHVMIFVGSIIMATALIAQPRDEQSSSSDEPSSHKHDEQQIATRELAAAYIAYLQQSGQLIPQPQENNHDREEKSSDEERRNEKEVKKFQEAASGIFTGMLTVVSGASSGDPVQIAAGIFGMLSTAIAVSTRKRTHDEEQPLPLAKRSRNVKRSIQNQLAQSNRPFKRRI